MADVILFHHALGRTDGVLSFADRLRTGGHRVTVPDLFDGRTFDSIEAGVAYVDSVGIESLIERGVMAAADMPDRCVYAGFSLGSLPAQKLAQTRTGALGAILYHGGIPSSNFGTGWPAEVALQIHIVEKDKWDQPGAAQQLTLEAPDSQLFIYPGTAHLVADSTFTDYDAPTAELMIERTLIFLSHWGSNAS